MKWKRSKPQWKLSSAISSLKLLTRLEIIVKSLKPGMLELLPPCLKYLLISCAKIKNMSDTLPPYLEVLMIEQTLTQKQDHFNLEFSLPALPPTLKTLGIIGRSFGLHPLDYNLIEGDNRLTLPLLETLYLVGLSLPDALASLKRFPSARLRRVLVVEPVLVQGEMVPPPVQIDPLELNPSASLQDAVSAVKEFKRLVHHHH